MTEGRRLLMGFFQASVHPGATVQASHYTREACVLERLEMEMPPIFEDVRLIVEPHRHVGLSEPRLSQYGLNIVFWDCQPDVIVPANCSIYVQVTRPNWGDEPEMLKAGIWAKLL